MIGCNRQEKMNKIWLWLFMLAVALPLQAQTDEDEYVIDNDTTDNDSVWADSLVMTNDTLFNIEFFVEPEVLKSL